jgi:glycosyltransferase involved in cell wall biosynthesis
MDYFPNVDGVIFLVRQVMPRVWEREPETRVAIVGRDPAPSVRALERDSRVIVTGSVPDVRPYLEAATVIAVPVRAGSGTRLKALEAAAMGKAIVATRLGLEGLAFSHGMHAWLADEPESFAAGILALIADCRLRRQLGRAARLLVEERYDWRRCAELLDLALRAVT